MSEQGSHSLMPFHRAIFKGVTFFSQSGEVRAEKVIYLQEAYDTGKLFALAVQAEAEQKPVREGMMKCLKIGSQGEEEMFVGRDDLANMMGNIGAEVLSTHRVVLLMELASRNAIKECLPEGKMTVGTFIRIRHLAATPLGSKVRAEAHLKAIDGRKLIFNVAAYDEFEKIAEGENEQLIVSIDKFLARIKKKTKE